MVLDEHCALLRRPGGPPSHRKPPELFANLISRGGFLSRGGGKALGVVADEAMRSRGAEGAEKILSFSELILILPFIKADSWKHNGCNF